MGAQQSDGAIHLAFSNDFSSIEALTASIVEETAAITAIGEEFVGSSRPFAFVPARPRSQDARPPRTTRCPPTAQSVAGPGR